MSSTPTTAAAETATSATDPTITQTNNSAAVTAGDSEVQATSRDPMSTTAHTASRSTDSVEVPRTPRGPARTDTTTAFAQALVASDNIPPPPPAATEVTSQRTRSQSTAIGPSVDQQDNISKGEPQSGPQLELTLLLTNGARHPFLLDNKYLAKRNVEAQGGDPFNLSVYKLKELILREWRDEWEQKPSSPSSIRLISFGKLLDDKSALKDLKFNRSDRNVVHMTIKPQDFVDDDDGKGAKSAFSSGRTGDDNRSPGCRCVIM